MKQTIAIAILLIGLASCKKNTALPQAIRKQSDDSLRITINVTSTSKDTAFIYCSYMNDYYVEFIYQYKFVGKFERKIVDFKPKNGGFIMIQYSDTLNLKVKIDVNIQHTIEKDTIGETNISF